MFNGDGMQPRTKRAAAACSAAAAFAGNPVAQNRLARMLATGRGIDQNSVEGAPGTSSRARGVADPSLEFRE